MTRRQVRYWLFRFRTEAEGGASSKGAPRGLRKHYEDHPHFGGWDSFGMTWDISADDVEVIIPLRYTLEQAWNTEAYANAKDLPEAKV